MTVTTKEKDVDHTTSMSGAKKDASQYYLILIPYDSADLSVRIDSSYNAGDIKPANIMRINGA